MEQRLYRILQLYWMGIEKIMNEIYVAEMTALQDEAIYRRLYLEASPERRQKADAYLPVQNRRLCIAADALLRAALLEHGVTDYEVAIGEYGKPYLKNAELQFNLSHSGERVMCVVSEAQVGCDVERCAEASSEISTISEVTVSFLEKPESGENPEHQKTGGERNLKIAERFFHPDEVKLLQEAASDARQQSCESVQQLFYRLWTLKESYLKCIGTGMHVAMNDFCIHVDRKNTGVQPDQNISAKIDGNAVSGENSFPFVTVNNIRQPVYLKEYALADGYCYAVCSQSCTFSEVHRITFS